MSDTLARATSDRRQDQVVWPDPSPLAAWWDSVMNTEKSSAPAAPRFAR
ncbi:hypothetical protein ABZ942_19460 [Nocardia sp. NPDC046473]